MTQRIRTPLVAIAGLAVACTRAPEPRREVARAPSSSGATYTVHDTVVNTTFDAAGVAAAVEQATLSTKLMGSVTQVLVNEGDQVGAGQLLASIDSRDLSAKAAQVAANIAEAQAVQADATTQAKRMRALYADSAATRAQLDAAETGLARADAGLRAAQAAASEVSAATSYAEIRAPFAGVVTKRFVDPGSFAAPGAPLISIQDASTLRIAASAPPDLARGLRRGQTIDASIEGRSVRARVEGVVPAAAGNLYTINALVANPDHKVLAGSSATLSLPLGARHALVVPLSAVIREGDLTGVAVRSAQGDERRWVRLGATTGDVIEISAGLRAGDQVVLPAAQLARGASGN